jgi:polygalacturonase
MIPDLGLGEKGHVELHKLIRGRLQSVLEHPSIQAAIDAGANIPPGVYDLQGTTLTVNKTMMLYGVTLKNCALLIGSDVQILGGTIHVNEDGGTLYEQVLDIKGSHITLRDVRILDSSKVQRDRFIGVVNADNVTIDNISSDGRQGWYIQGHDIAISNCHQKQALVASDDGYAIKAIERDTYNITINNCTFENAYSFIAIGTEVNRNMTVRNVTASNCSGINCANVISIKPGAEHNEPYPMGIVENINITNCTLYDRDGVNMRTPVFIHAGCGATVQGVNISDILIRGRLVAELQQVIALKANGIHIAPTIKQVRISNLSYIDSGSELGSGAHYGINAQINDAGTLQDISIRDCYFDGLQVGQWLGADVDVVIADIVYDNTVVLEVA